MGLFGYAGVFVTTAVSRAVPESPTSRVVTLTHAALRGDGVPPFTDEEIGAIMVASSWYRQVAFPILVGGVIGVCVGLARRRNRASLGEPEFLSATGVYILLTLDYGAPNVTSVVGWVAFLLCLAGGVRLGEGGRGRREPRESTR